jgi:hypothetical protein
MLLKLAAPVLEEDVQPCFRGWHLEGHRSVFAHPRVAISPGTHLHSPMLHDNVGKSPRIPFSRGIPITAACEESRAMPSHKMMSFCFLLGRDGGRNSLTMSFLNRVLNISRHYLLGTPRVTSRALRWRTTRTLASVADPIQRRNLGLSHVFHSSHQNR